MAIQRASADVLDELAAMLGCCATTGEQAARGADARPGADRRPGRHRCATPSARDARAVDGPLDDGAEARSGPPPTASCRSRSPTWSATRPRPRTVVAVRVDADRGLTVEVTDDGAGAARAVARAPAWASGACGSGPRRPAGTFEAGPRPGGGFTVRATWDGPVVIRVVLADDQPLVRAGFRMLLDAEDDIDGRRRGRRRRGGARPRPRRPRPDVVLMDIRMPGDRRPRGAAHDHRRRRAGRGVKVLVLTTFELDEYVFEAVRFGASGFLVKHTQPADLVRARPGGRSRGGAAVAQRDPPADRGVRGPSRPARRSPRRRWTCSPTASVRSSRWSRTGLTNDEIAAELVVSPATARTHVSRAMVKLHARDRAQLVVFAYQSGLVRPAT